MFAIGYHNRPPLPATSSRSPVTKKILSISWKIDHFQTRSGVIQSVLFSTNSLYCGSSSANLSNGENDGTSFSSVSDNQPSEIWCLELDTNKTPFDDRAGVASLQQEPDQQVPVVQPSSQQTKYGHRLLNSEKIRTAHTSFRSTCNRSDVGGYNNTPAGAGSNTRSSPRVASPSEFDIRQQQQTRPGQGLNTGIVDPQQQNNNNGQTGNGGGGTGAALLLGNGTNNSPMTTTSSMAMESSSSNYMSLYLRLVYWKQEFSTVQLKAGVFTDRMEVTVLGDKEFQTDDAIGWAQFINKESVSRFILGQDKQDDNQGYIQLYLELVLNESKRKEGVECKSLAHNDLILDFSVLLQQKALSDITLVCGDKKLEAHKAVLAARSPIFRAMFTHPSQESQTNQIELKDVDFEILEELVNFIYTGQVTRLDQLADCLLPVADKYDIVSLVKLCEESLSFNLTVENVVHRLVLSYLHNAVTLKRAALGFIERNICTVRLTDGWMQAQLKYPQLFLDSFPNTEQLSLIVSKSMMSF